MFAEGETELRDLIIQNLESCGFLNKIKAELRAGVFLAFEEGSLRKKIPLFNDKFDKFIESSDGKLAVSLVREFLEYFNLKFTLSVFDPEIATTSPCLTRSDLCNQLNLKLSDVDGPVLSSLISSDASLTLKRNNSESVPKQLSTVSYKSLETISEDFPSKEKDQNDHNSIEVSNSDSESKSFQQSSSNGISEPIWNFQKPSSTSSIIDKLRNEQKQLESKNKESKLSVFDAISEESNTKIFKGKEISTADLDLDPFFDEPLPTEKPSYFAVPNDSALDTHNSKDSLNSNSLFGSENALSSLKDLPSLTNKIKDWTFSRELQNPKALPSLELPKPTSNLDKIIKKDDEEASQTKNDLDPESTEESSDRQLNSEDSIEEEIEEDFSVGLDDLLNSSLSLGDDVTTDQSVSQVSVVDGVDHIEPVNK